jgi:hypothetical protein
MPDRFIEGQDLILEVDTLDSTLPSHTNRKIHYVEPLSDGKPGDPDDALSVNGVAVAGQAGDSVNRGESIRLLKGVYLFWSESDNAGGKHCVSPANSVPVEKKGTVRR